MVKYNKKTELIFFIIFFCAFFVLSILTPIAGDDFIYSFNDNSNVRPLNLYDIYMNMEMQREFVTTRVVCHFFVQLFLMLPRWIFWIINAAVNTFSAYVMYSFFRSGKKTDIFLLTTAVAIVWCFMPVFGQVFLWLDGSCNYSWCIALMLAYILPFYRTFTDGICSIKKYQVVFLSLFSLIFGAYSENAVIAAQVIVVLLMIYIYSNQKRIYFELVIPCICTFIGYIFILTAPILTKGDKGNLNVDLITVLLILLVCAVSVAAVWLMFRFKKLLKYAPIPISIVWIATVFYLKPDTGGIWSFLSSTYICIPTFIALFLCILCFSIYKEIEKKRIISAFIFALGSVASVAIFAFAIYFPARSMCYAVILLTTACIIMLEGIIEKGDIKLVRIFSSAILVLFAFCFIIGTADIISVNAQYKERLRLMAEAHAKGENTVILNEYDYKTKYTAIYGLEDIGPNPDEYWINRYMADYYGFDAIYSK